MPRRIAIAVARFVLATGLIGVLPGCSPGSRPLVRVGSQRVTVQDFERAARGAQAQYQAPPAIAKAQLLQDLTRRMLLLEYAHRLGQDTSSVVRNLDRENSRRLLVQMLFARIASQAQPVSEAEARALYEARKQEAHVFVIYTSSLESALAAKTRIERGEPFGDVSRAYSLPGVLPPGGDMGMVQPGALPDSLDVAVRRLSIGAIGGPYREREGWFLIRVTERRPHAQVPWEALRAGMFDLERQRKQRAAFNRAYEDLKAEWQYEPAPGGSQLLFRVTSPVEPLTPSPEQRKMPLARYANGVYTLQDALDDMQDANVQRPPAQLQPMLEVWIEQQAMTRVAVLEARRRHLDEEPELVASLRKQREDALLESVYQSAVAVVPPPGPDLVKLAWEQMKSRFTKLTAVHITSVSLPDSGMVAKLVQQGGSTRSLADAAKALDPSLAVTDTVIHYPGSDPAWTAFEAMFTQLRPGAWYGPEPIADPATGRAVRWRVIQLLNKVVAQQAFEELPAPTQQNIASSAAELARDARFQQFADSLERAYQPVVNRDLLPKLAWPGPGTAAATTE